MGSRQAKIGRYEIAKIYLAVCFIGALKVWDNTGRLELSILTFLGPIFIYLIVKGIQGYLHRKDLLESGIDVIDNMSGEEFEELLLVHYMNLGYSGELTLKAGD